MVQKSEGGMAPLAPLLPPPMISILSRAYRAAEGGERACNSRTSCIEGEMLAVTKFKSKSDTL